MAIRRPPTSGTEFQRRRRDDKGARAQQAGDAAMPADRAGCEGQESEMATAEAVPTVDATVERPEPTPAVEVPNSTGPKRRKGRVKPVQGLTKEQCRLTVVTGLPTPGLSAAYDEATETLDPAKAFRILVGKAMNQFEAALKAGRTDWTTTPYPQGGLKISTSRQMDELAAGWAKAIFDPHDFYPPTEYGRLIVNAALNAYFEKEKNDL